MTSTAMFFTGIFVQLLVGILQVSAAIVLVYRWQRQSWMFSNIMKIREPLARAYCSLSAVIRARHRLADDIADETKSVHDEELIHQYLVASQDEILNFSVEHFKAKFWLTAVQNQQLDVLFDKLRDEWRAVRNAVPNPEGQLDDLRREIMRFDGICGLNKYGGAQWSHVALHDD
jgi:hypothetical protein